MKKKKEKRRKNLFFSELRTMKFYIFLNVKIYSTCLYHRQTTTIIILITNNNQLIDRLTITKLQLPQQKKTNKKRQKTKKKQK